MSFFSSLVRPLLFSLDPEMAHELACKAIRNGLASGLLFDDPVTVAGIKFRNRVGLAAGFDKDGKMVDMWHNLGFGFVEIGTVTRRAQPGNDRPRLFRYPSSHALINRMGFNNLGADDMAKRLAKSTPQLPMGINIGKSKVTSNSEAADDYAYSLTLLKDFGDYFVVNVSSPNTPGLRGLQDKDSLNRLLWRLKEVESVKPMFVKIAPDLDEDALKDIVQVVTDMGLTGIVATNTTVSRDGLPAGKYPEGGLSGLPLTSLSDKVLGQVREMSPDLVLIGSGGVMTPEDGVRKIKLGASLVQAYTGWIYGGPDWTYKVAKACAAS